ncbi:MAG: DUF951 domain-containing protein [Chloroflexi bacterium]|nr:DUF951 domain-containing protein [Chloroflexota bacterium]MBI3762255.1 DUF951 domain-containing protein [Chloroflexota bacterium]
MPVEIQLDDLVRLRKLHPCGSYDWRVVRVGADIGLRCLKCDRRVLLPRREFEKRLKTILKGDDALAALETARLENASRPEGAPAGGSKSGVKGRRK